jgi:Putative beta-barrel porin-2, OmpL-like. bbp2
MKRQPKLGRKLKTAGVCMGMVVGGAMSLHADPVASSSSSSNTDTNSLQKLAQENQQLKSRLDALESVAQKEGWMPSDKKGDPPVGAMTDIALSGFVTTSYFHDSSEPPNHVSPGYLWNRVNDNFTLNKVKVTLASPPVERSGENFSAAFRVSLIYGQDAPIVNSGSSISGFNAIREAYLEMNIPVGTGLNFKAGELISLLNYESGDGGAVNANFSQGFQWFFTGNGPAEGAQLGYTFTDWLDVKVRIQNGLYAGPVDNNSSKTFVAAIDLKPMDSLWVNVLGFGGREDSVAENVIGAEVLAGWKATKQLTFGTELDYFNFYNPQTAAAKGHSDVYSAGLWTDYAFTKQFDLALRAEYLMDHDGADITGGTAAGGVGPGGPLGLYNPPGIGQDIASAAFTINYTPIPTIKIQPEIRYDHTSYSGGWVPGKQNRIIFGAGASYLF